MLPHSKNKTVRKIHAESPEEKKTIFKKRRKNFYDRGQKKFTGLKALNIRYTLMDCYLVVIHWPSEAFGGDRI